MHGRCARSILPFVVALALCGAVPPSRRRPLRSHPPKPTPGSSSKKVGVLAGQLTAAVRQYETATDRLALVAARLVEDQRQLADAQQELIEAQRDLTALVIGMYKQSPTSVLDMFVGVGSLEDLVTRVRLLDSVGRNSAGILEQCRQRSDQMERRQMQVQADQLQARRLVVQIARQKEQLGASLMQNKTALGKAKADVQRIAKQILAERVAAAAARAAAAGGSIQAVPLTGILGAYTQQTWAQALLKNLGLPVSAANVAAIVSPGEMAEGGHWYNTARFNPLNTTMSAPGATAMNSVGVKAYTSWEQGFAATIATLFNGYYAGILAALERGDDAQAVANAVAASPWGTGSFSIRSHDGKPSLPGSTVWLELHVLHVFQDEGPDPFHGADPLERLLSLVSSHKLARPLQVVPLEESEEIVRASARVKQAPALGPEPLAALGVVVKDRAELVVVGDVVVDEHVRHEPAPYGAVHPSGLAAEDYAAARSRERASRKAEPACGWEQASWSRRTDSNRRPATYEAAALPAELRRPGREV